MTQYLATCSNCGGKVNQLEQTATVDTCDACKGDVAPPMKKRDSK